jgi:exopolysaccharide biosynthesis polyprenyl glycosylphosphotransferase
MVAEGKQLEERVPSPHATRTHVRDAQEVITPSAPAYSARRRADLFRLLCTVLADAAAVWLAFSLAYFLRYDARLVPAERGTFYVPYRDWLPFGVLFCGLMLATLATGGLYRVRLGRDMFADAGLVLRAGVITIGILVIVATLSPVVEYSRLVIVYTWVLVLPLLCAERAVLQAAYGRLRGGGWNTRRVLVVGNTPLGKMVMQNVLHKRNSGYRLIGFVQEGPALTTRLSDFGRFKCLGALDDIVTVVETWRIDEVIVALPAGDHAAIVTICAHCEQAGVAVKLIPDLFELKLARVRMDQLAGIPLIDVRHASLDRRAQVAKRIMDIVLSSIFLLVLAPLMMIVALAVKMDSPGPIFVRQQRVGKDGRSFAFYKFRSMYVGAEHNRDALAAQQGITAPRIFKDRADPRRTRVGRIIRQLSCDELPQIFNVLRGDMSLVGPRPPLQSEVALYEDHHLKRLQVKGGITGLWQVSGRSTIESFEEIVTMDTYYIENWSLLLDLRILLRTVGAVVSRKGAY